MKAPFTQGTPKTLRQALINGIDAGNCAYCGEDAERIAKVLEEHVREYMAQKFTPDLMMIKGIPALWKRIFPR